MIHINAIQVIYDDNKRFERVVFDGKIRQPSYLDKILRTIKRTYKKNLIITIEKV